MRIENCLHIALCVRMSHILHVLCIVYYVRCVCDAVCVRVCVLCVVCSVRNAFVCVGAVHYALRAACVVGLV
jgi:hypothetical protein